MYYVCNIKEPIPPYISIFINYRKKYII